jgi:hypothetical protein
MDFELTQPAIFPPTTVVKAYEVASVPDRTAKPTGPSIDEAEADAKGLIKFEGLKADVSYYAGAEVGGVWRYVHFTPGTPGVDVLLDADGDETVTGDWTFGGDTTTFSKKAIVKGEIELDGDLNHDGPKVGFFGVAPATQPTALTAVAADVVDNAYGEPEAKVLANLRTRSEQLETKLKALGLLA